MNPHVVSVLSTVVLGLTCYSADMAYIYARMLARYARHSLAL